MASRASLIQSRSIYVGTLNSVAPSDGNLIVTGNVGIGTTSPTENLHVYGTGNQIIKIENSGTYLMYLGLVSNEGYIGSSNATPLTFYTNNVSRMYITTGGNVGIGTTAPSGARTVIKTPGVNDANEIALQLNHGDGGLIANQEVQLGFGQGDGTTSLAQIAAAYTGGSFDGALIFKTNAASLSERMRITAAGNVGIGTTAPTALLTVAGTTDLAWSASTSKLQISRSSTVARLQNYENGSASTNLALQWEGGNVGIGTTAPGAKLQVGGASTDVELLRLSVNYDSSRSARGGINWHDTTNTTGRIYTEYDGGSMVSMVFGSLYNGGYNSNDLMIIRGNGNVGIGTTNPGERLHVVGPSNNWATHFVSGTSESYFSYGAGYGAYINAGTSASSSTYVLELISNNSTRMFVRGDGNVGIGTTSPAYKLHVKGSANYDGVIAVDNSTTTGGGVLIIRQNGVNSGFIGVVGSALGTSDRNFAYFAEVGLGHRFFVNDGTTALTITSAGNVGIGTTNPSEKLHIDGRARIATIDNGTGDFATISGTGVITRRTAAQVLTDIGAQAALTNPVTGTGTTNYVPKWTGASALGDSLMVSNSTGIGIGISNPTNRLYVQGQDSNNLYDNIIGVFRGAGTSTTNYAEVYIQNDAYDALVLGSIGSNYSGSSWAGARYIYAATGDLMIKTLDPSTNLRFYTAGAANERMRITAAGNVGIGTTSPNAKLNIRGTDGSGSVTPQEDVLHVGGNELGGVGGYAGIRIGGAGNTSYGAYIRGVKTTAYGNYWNTALTFSVTRTNTETTIDEVMRITSGANVLIGTTTDDGYKLRVNGTSYFDGLAHFGQTATSGSAFRWGSYGTAVSADTMLCMNQLWNGSGWTILNSGVGTTYLNLGGEVASPTIQFGTGPANTAATTKMIILNNGNVGIGTTNPTEKLDVAGNGKLQGNLYLTAANPYIEGSGSGAMRIRHTAGQTMYIRPDQTGDVSFFEGASGQIVYMSTATPSVNSTQNSSSTLTFEARARNAGGTLNIKSTSLQNTVYDIASNLSRFSITGQNVLYLDGNVGIGTDTPLSRLHTKGEIRIEDATDTTTRDYILKTETTGALSFTDSVSGERMRIDYNGNVGIGNTSPQFLLHVGSAGARMRVGPYYTSGGDRDFVDLIADGTDSKVLSNNERFHIENNAGDIIINPSGNVGIGTTAPTAKLTIGANTVVQSTNGIALGIGQASLEFVHATFNNGFGSKLYSVDSGGGISSLRIATRADSTAWSDAVTIIAGTVGNGNVGIGTTAPGQKLQVDGNIYVNDDGTTGNGIMLRGADRPLIARGWDPFTSGNKTGVGRWGVYMESAELFIGAPGTDYSNALITLGGWLLNGTRQPNLTLNNSTQRVGIGTTSPSYKLDVTGDIRINTGALGVNVAPSATDGRIDASNDIVAFSSSDLRLKENIKPIENALDKVKSLTGVEFDWKPELKHAHGYEGHDTGVIAQEVQEVMPTAIRTNDTGYLAVRYEKLIGLLIEAVKEQQAEIDELKSKLK